MASSVVKVCSAGNYNAKHYSCDRINLKHKSNNHFASSTVLTIVLRIKIQYLLNLMGPHLADPGFNGWTNFWGWAFSEVQTSLLQT